MITNRARGDDAMWSQTLTTRGALGCELGPQVGAALRGKAALALPAEEAADTGAPGARSELCHRASADARAAAAAEATAAAEAADTGGIGAAALFVNGGWAAAVAAAGTEGVLRHCREYRFEWILPLRTTLAYAELLST